MTQQDVPEAKVETKRSFSIVWLIPIVAALAGAFVAYRALSDRGPGITITFRTADGLEAGKTKLKYKDVEVGLVDSVVLEPDLSGITVSARMAPGADAWLREKTRFWVVRPRIAGGQISGLETLLAGSYIAVDPVLEGPKARKFEGLDVPPVVTSEEAGRFYMLRAERAGTLDVGSPVYFNHIAVGKVVSSALDPEGDFVMTRIFVQAPFDARVHENSRFWNASGIDVSLSAQGIEVHTQSLVSILIGGLAFDTPPGAATELAAAETVFPLYENREAAAKRHYTKRVAYRLFFNQSVRGLNIGTPVEFRGIEVGQVTDVQLQYDPVKLQFLVPVTIEIEPERFTNVDIGSEQRHDAFDKLVAHGLRGQLKTGNLLTGQLILALDFFPNAPPAKVDWAGPAPTIPTVPTPLEEITANLARLVERLSKLPVEKIGADLQASLASLRVTLQKSEDTGPALKAALEQAQRTLSSANALIAPDSVVDTELRRTLVELAEAARALALAADQIESQPDSLIWGKKGSK